jgi:hypothetical protein
MFILLEQHEDWPEDAVEFLKAAATWASDKLNLKHEIGVRLLEKHPFNYGTAYEYTGNYFQIDVRWSRIPITTLFHELAHIYQYQSNKLDKFQVSYKVAKQFSCNWIEKDAMWHEKRLLKEFRKIFPWYRRWRVR